MTQAEINKSIAQEIFSQLGGNHFLAMTGAKIAYSASAERGNLDIRISFRASKLKYIKITLNGLDLYDIALYKSVTITKEGKFPEPSETLENVYAEDMVEILENRTGLVFSL